MKLIKYCILFVIPVFFATGCKKDDKPVYSGTITIDNELFGSGPYYAYAFSVPTGKKVSTLNDPLDAIIILEDHDIDYNVRKIYFSCRNFEESFSLYGEYPDAATATQAFNGLTSFANPIWAELGDNVKENQVWLFRTSDDKYSKIRVIDTLTEKRDNMPFPYAECTFEWVFQPDGSLTFPGK